MHDTHKELKDRKLIFYGRFPAYNEVGGVTTYTFNASNILNPKSTFFVDMWKSRNKQIPSGVNYSILERRSLSGLIVLLRYILSPKKVHFFNLSSVRSCIAFTFLPKIGGSDWIAIFHHGEQKEEYEKLNFLLKFFVRVGINRFRRVGYLSQLQNYFYQEVYNGELLHVSPYLASKNPTSRSQIIKASIPSILLSGFPSSIYRIIETLKVLEDLYAEGYRFSANICIYGESNLSDKENLTKKIEKLITSYAWATLYSHLESSEFNKVLLSSSLYLRMNSEDSFGLVVAEAIESGLDVIATNVCTRYQGAYLLSKDDFSTLKKSLVHYLNGNNLEEIMDVQKSNMEFVELKSFCSLND